MPGTVPSTVGNIVVNETLLASRGLSFNRGSNSNTQRPMVSFVSLKIIFFTKSVSL